MRRLLRRLAAFLWGMREYRAAVTRGYYDTDGNATELQDDYDAGREIAHRLTGRRYEP